MGALLSAKQQTFTGDGNVLRQVCYIGVFVAAALTARGLKDVRRLLVIPLPLIAALAWCALSLSWAVAPAIGMRRLVLTATIIWSVFLVIREAGFTRSVETLRWFLAAALVLNFAAIPLLPAISIHHAVEFGDPGLVGDWRGLMGHKNFAGPACAFTILYFVFGAGGVRPFMRAAVLLGAAFFLYKTGSKTSMGLTAISLAAGGAMRFYDPRFRWVVLPILITGLAAAIVITAQFTPELTTRALRPEAFTGRGQIWPMMIAYIQDHPMTGAGFGSFWNIGPESPAFEYGRGWIVAMAQGHNGYLDLLAAVGAPGFVLVVVACFVVPAAKLLTAPGIARERLQLLFASLLFCAGHNLTETTLFDRDTITQVFLMVTIALIYRVHAAAVVLRERTGHSTRPPVPLAKGGQGGATALRRETSIR